MHRCDITGKGKQYGRNVSFSLNRTSKVWKANLQDKVLVIDGKVQKVRISTQGLRTLKKQGRLSELPRKTKTAKK